MLVLKNLCFNYWCEGFSVGSSSINLRLTHSTVTTRVVATDMQLILVVALVLGPPEWRRTVQDGHIFLIIPVTRPTMIWVVLELLQRRCYRQMGFTLSIHFQSRVPSHFLTKNCPSV